MRARQAWREEEARGGGKRRGAAVGGGVHEDHPLAI